MDHFYYNNDSTYENFEKDSKSTFQFIIGQDDSTEKFDETQSYINRNIDFNNNNEQQMDTIFFSEEINKPQYILSTYEYSNTKDQFLDYSMTSPNNQMTDSPKNNQMTDSPNNNNNNNNNNFNDSPFLNKFVNPFNIPSLDFNPSNEFQHNNKRIRKDENSNNLETHPTAQFIPMTIDEPIIVIDVPKSSSNTNRKRKPICPHHKVNVIKTLDENKILVSNESGQTYTYVKKSYILKEVKGLNTGTKNHLKSLNESNCNNVISFKSKVDGKEINCDCITLLKKKKMMRNGHNDFIKKDFLSFDC